MDVDRFGVQHLGATMDFARRAGPDFVFNWAESEPLFRWKYMEQVQRLADGELPVWIARDGDRVVGFLGAAAYDFWFADQAMPGNAAMDYYLEAACRGRGVGKELLRCFEASARLNLIILSSRQAHEIFLHRGYQELSGVCAHYGIWGLPGRVRWGLRKLKLTSFDFAAADSADRLRAFLSNVPGLRVPDAGDRETVDAFLRKAQEQYSLAPLRTYAYMEWKYRLHPDRHGEIFVLEGDGEIQAVFALANRRMDGPPMLAIGDLFLRHPEDVATIRLVLELCGKAVRATGAHASVALDPGGALGRELRNVTMTRSQSRRCSMLVDDCDARAELAKSYISAGDGDFIR
jgi:hypothetical protein